MPPTIRNRALRLAAALFLTICAAPAQPIEVMDLALETGFQNFYDQHLQRGRANIAADFNLDGTIDFFIGNPGDTSVVLEGRIRQGRVRLRVAQVLLVDELAWGGTAFDYDNDGDYDLFVNVNILNSYPLQVLGRNILWRNNGDRTFTDVTDAVGLGDSFDRTFHSTFLDIDNDGDVDLFENNRGGPNILYRNLLVETGSVFFEDATTEFSPPGEDLHYPEHSFVSATADFNNDGWEDLVVFAKGSREGNEPGSPYPLRHVLFLNQTGKGFVNVAESAGLNNPYIGADGVMGCQVGDLNFDGSPDVYIGNGSPGTGTVDQLFLSQVGVEEQPHFINRTDLIDCEAPQEEGVSYPPYPYRTHGTTFVDVDGDGGPEIAVVNGGPRQEPDEVREPNRLFKLRVGGPTHFLWVWPVGDGIHVSRDAIGSRVAVEVSNQAGDSWTVYRTLLGGNAFSAQNGFDLFFGLRDAVSVDRVAVTWPDGTVKVVEDGVALDSRIVVTY